MQDAHTSTKCTGSSNTTREKQYNDESSCEKEVSLHIETTQQQMRSQEKQHNNDFSRKREIAQCLLFSWPTQLPPHCTHTHTVSVCVCVCVCVMLHHSQICNLKKKLDLDFYLMLQICHQR